jgi:hypothetical protein
MLLYKSFLPLKPHKNFSSNFYSNNIHETSLVLIGYKSSAILYKDSAQEKKINAQKRTSWKEPKTKTFK